MKITKRVIGEYILSAVAVVGVSATIFITIQYNHSRDELARVVAEQPSSYNSDQELSTLQQQLQDSQDAYNRLEQAVVAEHGAEISSADIKYCGPIPLNPNGSIKAPTIGQPDPYDICIQSQNDAFIDQFVANQP